jgi:lipid A ethanolaminephosphotransferase
LKNSQDRGSDTVPAQQVNLSTEALLGLSAIYGALVFNQGLYALTLELHSWRQPGTWLLLLGLVSLVAGLHFLLLGLVATQKTVKFWVLLFGLAGSVAAVYHARYQVYFDPSMLRNVVHTQYTEAKELLSWGLLGSLAAYFLPLLLAMRYIRVTPISRARGLGRRFLAWVAVLALMIVTTLILYAPLGFHDA